MSSPSECLIARTACITVTGESSAFHRECLHACTEIKLEEQVPDVSASQPLMFAKVVRTCVGSAFGSVSDPREGVPEATIVTSTSLLGWQVPVGAWHPQQHMQHKLASNFSKDGYE